MENLKKEFVPYTEAFELKQLGFDEPCFGRFDGRGKNKGKIWYEMPNTGQDSIPVGDVLAPTYSQAFRWFREKHNLFSSEVYDRGLNNGKIPIIHSYSFRILNLNNFEDFYGNVFKTYEEAELACLRKLIELFKNK